MGSEGHHITTTISTCSSELVMAVNRIVYGVSHVSVNYNRIYHMYNGGFEVCIQ